MTFGEKLQAARKDAGLTQEQLAQKLIVSRSAVAKWESDKGMPDVENLKAMAQLLDVSVDYLLAEDQRLSFNETREPVDLDTFHVVGECRSNKDAACYAKFAEADAIYPLIRSKKMGKLEWLVDFIVGPGIIRGADYLNDSSAWYLVEEGSRQLLVSVSEDFLTTRELANHVDPKRFEFGNQIFKKATYRLR